MTDRSSAGATQPIKVLIVEDNRTMLYLLAKLVRRLGYRPLPASTGRMAAEILNREHIDLCLLDLTLPDTTGQLLCRAIRQQSTVPVIVVSGDQSVDSVVEMLLLGADEYIPKPVNSAVLEAKIFAQLRRDNWNRSPGSRAVHTGISRPTTTYIAKPHKKLHPQ